MKQDILDMSNKIKIALDPIYRQREEVLQAFVAKYGCEPDECEQVVISDQSSTIRWFIRKRQVSPDEEENKTTT